ncbi:adenylate kinase-domain-containing protein [Rhodotorula diobovata]|uniref:Adenylate kinase-domain-containing protein n=1 Tax=Rhodotorula diobovata TaxID=5288 RepID=A0A5C5G566_9BASI|nr:adenylate kinase-domain-containing protein [Rhodotorula diobovata]
MLARTALPRRGSAPVALSTSRPTWHCQPAARPSAPRRSLASSVPHDAQPGDKKLRMILLGAPGAGKGTLSDWLIDKYDVDTVVVGQLLRNEILKGTQLGRTAESTMKAGGLLPDELVLEVVQPAVDALRDRNWILDGFPRKASQATLLDQLLGKTDDHLNFVASLKVPDQVILDRIADRFIHLPSGRTYNLKFNPPRVPGKDDVTGEPLSQRPDDQPGTVRTRLAAFHAENDPLLAHYDGALVAFEGQTSKQIWPGLEAALVERFPNLPLRTTPRAP